MRLLHPAALALVTSSLLFAQTARAQRQGFALDRFDPADRGSEWFVADSLDLRGHLRVAGGVVGSWAYKPLVAYDVNGVERATLVEHQVFVHPGASLVLWNRVRGAVSLPLAVYQTGTDVAIRDQTYTAPTSAAGDLRFSGDLRVFGEHRRPITGALGFALYFPTGSRENYTSDGTVRVTPRASISGDISIFTYAARLGLAVRPLNEKFERNPLGSEATVTLAGGIRTAHGRLVVGPELFGSTIIDKRSFMKRRGTPLEWLIGAHYTVSDFRFGGGVGTGLTRGWGTPTLRAFLSAEWTPGTSDDDDRDGIKNTDDACPSVAGIRTKDPKTNGCPAKAQPTAREAPSDRDGDGILDQDDACPDLAGVASTDRTKNGCPPDRDGDGIYDAVNTCPDVPGPKSDDPQKNGCPPDRDGDGIADSEDSCPDLAGERSKDPLSNGCPADRDGDGIFDKEDACPDAAGPADPDPQHNGCPLARIEDGQIKIIEQVRFKSDSAEILRDSDTTLLAVASIMKSHPEVVKIRIEGHTDNRGKEAHNRELSYRRAVAVEKWLAKFGIDRKRLESKGYGPVRPIDSNATDDGREKNRRVEFHITETKAAPKP